MSKSTKIPSILEKIIDRKKIDLELRISNTDIDKLIKDAYEKEKTYSFMESLSKDGLSIIGEVKKASPSKGIIKEDFNHIEIANKYKGVVDAMSVLTEENFFLGKREYVSDIAKITHMPILRKDFITSEFEIYEAKILGASAVLLIAAVLSVEDMIKYIGICNKLGLDALVESHTLEEVEKSLEAGAAIMGINNRDLNTFKVDLNTTLELRKNIPKDKIIVSESGIFNSKDIKILKEAEINGILVGESFMRSEDISIKAKEFRDAFKNNA